MIFFIKLQFIILLIIYLYVFKTLLKKEIGFSLGILFSILFFIFIPLSVLVVTDRIEISKIDFHATNLQDVILGDNIQSSIMLIIYLYTIVSYIFFSEKFIFKKKKFIKKKRKDFPINWKIYLLIAFGLSIFIFLVSGIQNGGNWYTNRSSFFHESGFWGLIIVDSIAAFKLLFIASIILAFKKKKLTIKMLIFVIITFSLLDSIISGNRIYAFILFALVFVFFIKKYGKKVFYFFLLIIPFGYTMSIYRHIRGNLFLDGIPNLSKIWEITLETIKNNPPEIHDFLLGISESVNVNVIYQTFNYITIETAIWGESFLKTFVFLIPRSIWHDKPISITQIAAHYFAPQSEHLSLVTTLIGEIHINFYLFGIIVIPIILFLTQKLLIIMFKEGEFQSILLFLIALLLFRMPYSDIILVSFFVFLYYRIILTIGRLKFK